MSFRLHQQEVRCRRINYTPMKKECLEIIWRIRKLRCYIKSLRFDVVTDHLALKRVDRIENPTGRIVKWARELQQTEYDVHYRRGKYNKMERQ